jgi:hypothetical protein
MKKENIEFYCAVTVCVPGTESSSLIENVIHISPILTCNHVKKYFIYNS